MSEISQILREAKKLARNYRELTGKPLGITGELAEFTAAEILGLELSNLGQAGYDAIRKENGREIKIQIKGTSEPEKPNPGRRMGKLSLKQEWDVVVLVILDEDLEPKELYEAPRNVVAEALNKPGSKARNERGQLAISQFKSFGEKVWP